MPRAHGHESVKTDFLWKVMVKMGVLRHYIDIARTRILCTGYDFYIYNESKLKCFGPCSMGIFLYIDLDISYTCHGHESIKTDFSWKERVKIGILRRYIGVASTRVL